jgi:hypothetical protein
MFKTTTASLNVHVSPSASKGSLSAGSSSQESKLPLLPPKLVRTSGYYRSGDGDYELTDIEEGKEDAPLEKTTSLLPASQGVPINFITLGLRPKMSKAMKITTGTTIIARLATYITLPLSSAGFINASIAVNTVASVTEFASYAALFREFFVKSMWVHYQPQSRYQGPIGFVSSPTLTQASGQPLLVAPIHHGITPPSTVGALAENPEVRHKNTSDPWTARWLNIEKPTAVISPVASTGVPTQNWCLSDSTSAAAYTGSLLFLSQSVTGAPSSSVIGQFLVQYELIFRYRE